MTPDTERKLPDGWRWVRLTEVCSITAVQVDPRVPEYADLPHVNGERIGVGSCSLVGVQTAGEDGMVSGKYLFEAGDVLYSKLRPYLRKVVVAPWRGVCSADMYPVRCHAGLLDARFLCWLLVSHEFTRYADSESRRARMPKLNRDQFFAFTTPLPPLAEQQRIAAILTEQLAAVDRARAAAEAQLDAAKALPAAYLRAVFESDALPSGCWTKIGSVATTGDAIADGPFGSNLKTEHYTRSGARVIRLQNIGRGGFLDTDRAFVSMEHFASLTRHAALPGDIVVAALGDGARPAGRACQVPDGLGPALVKADCLRLRLPASLVYGPYLVTYLNSPVALGQIADLVRGATRPRVNLDILRNLDIPLPPVGEQKQIAAGLLVRHRDADAAVTALAAQLATIAELPAALLRQAFNGAL